MPQPYDANDNICVQSDAIELAVGINIYAYVGGNPISEIDLGGSSCQWVAFPLGIAYRCTGDPIDSLIHPKSIPQQWQDFLQEGRGRI
ncbi:hypothetical protein [Amantichitinum ursilacus]|uniref:hypothetical protein n=1 Tax=Amantichitinum ursilacus TaxID=857265 RepID=UPI00128F071B|nr:hypothetical protein [Amantichitinum ursilacus]